jgi:(p)ppGpp synthase/HD superfamily hydrolase
MALRLRTRARQHGLDAAGARLVDAAFRLAAQARPDHLQFATARLHPARTVLILLDLANDVAAYALAAAALVESEDQELVVSLARIEQHFDERVVELVAAVPSPAHAGEELLERLLVAPVPVQRIALAERLDHARHLHLRPQPLWAFQHALVSRAYLPVAEREGGTLGRRFRWWHDMFKQRYLRT